MFCFVFCACVVLVSDFVFVQGTGVIFKVALCLLSSHEGEIVECDTFESIVDYLKNTLPALNQTQMEQTIAKVQIGSMKQYEIQFPGTLTNVNLIFVHEFTHNPGFVILLFVLTIKTRHIFFLLFS